MDSLLFISTSVTMFVDPDQDISMDEDDGSARIKTIVVIS